MKKFKKGNVIIRTNDPREENELRLQGYEEVKEKPKKLEKKDKKASSE